MFAEQPGASIRMRDDTKECGGEPNLTSQRVEIDRDFTLVRTRTKDFSRKRNAHKSAKAAQSAKTWHAPKYEVIDELPTDDLEEITFALDEEEDSHGSSRNSTKSGSSPHGDRSPKRMRCVKNNGFLGDMVHNTGQSPSPRTGRRFLSGESKQSDAKVASKEVYKVRVGPGRLGMKLKPGARGQGALISGFSKIEGQYGPVESVTVAAGLKMVGMYLVGIGSDDVGQLDFPDLLRILRSQSHLSKDLFFSHSPLARADDDAIDTAALRKSQPTSTRAPEPTKRASPKPATKSTAPEVRGPAPAESTSSEEVQKELTLDDYLASLDDDEEEEESYSSPFG